MSDQPDAGWYEDPTQASQARYWDGSEWTASTRPHETSYLSTSADGRPDGRAGRTTWGIAALAVLALFAGALVVVTLSDGSGSTSNEVIVARGVGSGDLDLYAVNLGDDVDRDRRLLDRLSYAEPVPVMSEGARVDGTVDGRLLLVTRERDDDESLLQSVDVGNDEVTELLDAADLSAQYHRDRDLLSIVEHNYARSNEAICHTAPGSGVDPEEVVEADECRFVTTSELIIAYDYDFDGGDSNGVSAHLLRPSGEEVWGVGDVQSVIVADDGETAVVVEQRGSSDVAELVSTSSGEVLATSDRADSIRAHDVIGRSALLSVEDGDQQLMVLTPDGSTVLDESRDRPLYGRLSPEGRIAFVQTFGFDGEDAEIAIFNVSDGTELDRYEADRIDVISLTDPNRPFLVLLGHRSGVEFLVVGSDGSATEVFESRSPIAELRSVLHDRGAEHLYVSAAVDDDFSDAVFALDLQRGTGVEYQPRSSYLSIMRLTPNGSAIVRVHDDTDEILVVLDADRDFDEIEIDEIDDGSVRSVWLDPNGRLVYSLITDGDEEIRRARIGGEDVEVLYDDASLIAVPWPQPPVHRQYLQGD